MNKFCRRCGRETTHRKLSKIKDGFDAWLAASTAGMSWLMEKQKVECNNCGTVTDKG